MKTKLSKIFFIVLGIISLFLLSYTQIRESGTLQGNVTDDEGNPLPGVNITVTSPNLIGGPRSATTDKNGFFKFPFLLPGLYKIKAEIQGFNPLLKRGIQLHANISLTVDFKLTITKLGEEVVVEAVTPMIDIKSSSTGGIIITKELLNSLPVDRSKFWDIINLAPGIMNNIAYGSSSDQAPYANSWQIDGVEMSNPAGGQIWHFNPDFNIIDEINVKGLGLPAEYGEFTGTTLTATTKSGGNKFSTFDEIRYNGANWNAQNREKIPEEEWVNPYSRKIESQTNSILGVGSQVGYKILHDKLWFFISGEYQKVRHTAAQTTGQVSSDIHHKFFLKFTHQLTPSNKLNGSVLYGRQYSDNPLGMFGGSVDPEIGAETTRPAFYYNLNWTSILSPTTFFELKLGYNSFRRTLDPNKGRDVPGRRDLILQTVTENWPNWNESSHHSYQAKAHLSKVIPDFLGSHDFKIGAEFILSKTFTASGYSGNIYYMDRSGPYRRYEKPPTEHDHHFKTIIGFFQDRWSLTKRLTLNIGARYNHYWYKIPSEDRGVIYKGGTLAPRVGLSFDLFGDRKTVVKLHYGIYYEALIDSFFTGMETRYEIQDIYQWDAIIGDYVLFSSAASYPWNGIYEIDPDLKQPYISEIAGGFERELFKNASLSVNFYYRALGRTIGALDIGSEWRIITVTNPGPDGVVGTSDDKETFDAYDLVEPGKQYYLVTNPQKGDSAAMIEDPKRTITGVELIFTKRFSHRWQMIASYNYGITKGNTTSTIFSPRSPNQLIQPYGEGRIGINYPQPNIFKLQGNVLLPLDLNLGVMMSYSSGHPVFVSFNYALPVYGSWAFNGGKMGEFNTDAALQFSIRIEKFFKIFGGRLMYTLDVTNLFNTTQPVQRVYAFGPWFLKVNGVGFPRAIRVNFRFQY